ncbi:rubredoxin [Desulforamulus ruminis]|uniref:Rubredoxin-type Fe(Cys)4 protein n=1 Tax=Desulforamulus ruminis (strain ATCC 23193 / DSM 2154 / NCIMB 8452 / DL) TaxID=696281 RepID=F6DVI2_DESRL|nr:rubredoxin [Desulforamulus ruminis]AEG61442.1 Rubredoxin-type Fe(Cys)4 protein [Desulforamulus ruminis DSM 2154]
MKKWKCSLCGYIYDPEKERPPGELEGAARCKNMDELDELVESFKCPQCHAARIAFKPHEGNL